MVTLDISSSTENINNTVRVSRLAVKIAVLLAVLSRIFAADTKMTLRYIFVVPINILNTFI